MAYYPIEDFTVVSTKTQPEMNTELRKKIADGYEPVGDILFNSTEDDDYLAYSQSLIKRTNTDAQFIANMAAALKPQLDALNTQLTNINNKLQQLIDK